MALPVTEDGAHSHRGLQNRALMRACRRPAPLLLCLSLVSDAKLGLQAPVTFGAQKYKRSARSLFVLLP